MSDFEEFVRQRAASVEGLSRDHDLRRRATDFVRDVGKRRYVYNFDWLGLPIIQFPQDIVAIQELIWRIKPRAIVETGVARGGSLALSASILQLLGNDGVVVGVELELRPHNRKAITDHPLSQRIRIVDGSSTSPETFARVRTLVADRAPVLVFLDANHTHEHVLAELRHYSQLVAKNSYIVVFDTIVDELPAGYFADRPWGPGNNPRTAVQAFLSETDRFVVDGTIDGKLLVTSNPGGYLKCVKNP